MTEGSEARRIILSKEDLSKLSKEEIISKWQQQDAYIASVISGQNGGGSELARLQENEEQLRRQIQDAGRRENVLVMRLTAKEQEVQDCLNQIEELKRSQTPSSTQLKGMLLDPAVNLMFQRMKKEMEMSKEKLEQAQNDLAAWKFTPDGQTGKRLMAKCRMLLQENEELGKVISAGRTAKLEAEIALQKKFVEEMKASQAETDEFLVEMDEDVEGMQGTIYALQQQLKEARDELARLQQENQQLHSAARPAVRTVKAEAFQDSALPPTPQDVANPVTSSNGDRFGDGIGHRTLATAPNLGGIGNIVEHGHAMAAGELISSVKTEITDSAEVDSSSNANGQHESMDTSEALGWDSGAPGSKRPKVRRGSDSSTDRDAKGSGDGSYQTNGLPQPDSIDDDSLSNL